MAYGITAAGKTCANAGSLPSWHAADVCTKNAAAAALPGRPVACGSCCTLGPSSHCPSLPSQVHDRGHQGCARRHAACPGGLVCGAGHPRGAAGGARLVLRGGRAVRITVCSARCQPRCQGCVQESGRGAGTAFSCAARRGIVYPDPLAHAPSAGLQRADLRPAGRAGGGAAGPSCCSAAQGGHAGPRVCGRPVRGAAHAAGLFMCLLCTCDGCACLLCAPACAAVTLLPGALKLPCILLCWRRWRCAVRTRRWPCCGAAPGSASAARPPSTTPPPAPTPSSRCGGLFVGWRPQHCVAWSFG